MSLEGLCRIIGDMMWQFWIKHRKIAKLPWGLFLLTKVKICPQVKWSEMEWHGVSWSEMGWVVVLFPTLRSCIGDKCRLWLFVWEIDNLFCEEEKFCNVDDMNVEYEYEWMNEWWWYECWIWMLFWFGSLLGLSGKRRTPVSLLGLSGWEDSCLSVGIIRMRGLLSLMSLVGLIWFGLVWLGLTVLCLAYTLARARVASLRG